MKTCVTFADLVEIHRPQIEEMQRVGHAFSDPAAPNAGDAFSHQVKLVEGALRQTYREAAALARRTSDLEEVKELWSQMSAFCGAAIRALTSLKGKFPTCGTPQLYDLALDFKLAADKRHRDVLEEISCQNQELPKGLFP
jgi:hypothetical protein